MPTQVYVVLKAQSSLVITTATLPSAALMADVYAAKVRLADLGVTIPDSRASARVIAEARSRGLPRNSRGRLQKAFAKVARCARFLCNAGPAVDTDDLHPSARNPQAGKRKAPEGCGNPFPVFLQNHKFKNKTLKLRHSSKVGEHVVVCNVNLEDIVEIFTNRVDGSCWLAWLPQSGWCCSLY